MSKLSGAQVGLILTFEDCTPFLSLSSWITACEGGGGGHLSRDSEMVWQHSLSDQRNTELIQVSVGCFNDCSGPYSQW